MGDATQKGIFFCLSEAMTLYACWSQVGFWTLLLSFMKIETTLFCKLWAATCQMT